MYRELITLMAHHLKFYSGDDMMSLYRWCLKKVEEKHSHGITNEIAVQEFFYTNNYVAEVDWTDVEYKEKYFEWIIEHPQPYTKRYDSLFKFHSQL